MKALRFQTGGRTRTKKARSPGGGFELDYEGRTTTTPPTLGVLTKDLPAAGVLGDEVEHALGLHDLVQADDVRMSQQFHDADLTEDLGQVVLR